MSYALITGSSKGIGKGIAECLAQRNYDILLIARSEDLLQQVAKKIAGKYKVDVKWLALDLSQNNAAALVKNWVTQNNFPVAVLVNNAGITRDTLLMRMSEQQWDEVMNANLKSVFNLTKAVQKPMLKARKGSIINMSSVVGVKGNAGQTNYSASKAGILGLLI